MGTNLKINVLQTLVLDMFHKKCFITLNDDRGFYSHHYTPIYMRAQEALIDIGLIDAKDCLYVAKRK